GRLALPGIASNGRIRVDRRGMEDKRHQTPGALLSPDQDWKKTVGIRIRALAELLRRCRAHLALCMTVLRVVHVLAFAADQCIESPAPGPRPGRGNGRSPATVRGRSERKRSQLRRGPPTGAP